MQRQASYLPDYDICPNCGRRVYEDQVHKIYDRQRFCDWECLKDWMVDMGWVEEVD